MGFEAKVLDIVDSVIPVVVYSRFFNGTLFVECTAREAAKLESAFIEALPCGVIVSSVEGEFAFDFV